MLLEMDKKELKLFDKGEYAVIYVDHTYGYVDPDDAAVNRYYRRKNFSSLLIGH